MGGGGGPIVQILDHGLFRKDYKSHPKERKRCVPLHIYGRTQTVFSSLTWALYMVKSYQGLQNVSSADCGLSKTGPRYSPGQYRTLEYY